jgi:hypothetical protein
MDKKKIRRDRINFEGQLPDGFLIRIGQAVGVVLVNADRGVCGVVFTDITTSVHRCHGRAMNGAAEQIAAPACLPAFDRKALSRL